MENNYKLGDRMSNIKLIIDSGTDLPNDIIEKYNISKVNLNVTFGKEHFFEEDSKLFYDKMRKNAELPKTSAPAPDKYIEIFEKSVESLVLSFTSKLSATYSSARLAKDILLEKNTEKNIEVIDTLNGCVGSGLLSIFAGELISN